MSKSRKRRLLNFLWLVVPIILFHTVVGFLFAFNDNDYFVETNNTIQSRLQNNIPDYEWGGNAVVTLWFDDAWASQYEEAFPIVEQYGYIAALAVPTRLIGYEAYMNWYQVRRLHYAGWEIVSHSRTHDCDFVDGSLDEIRYEILGGKEDLLNYAGVESDIYVAPCGFSSDETEKLVTQHFSAQRLVVQGINELPLTDKFEIKVKEVGKDTTAEDIEGWLNEAVTARGWLILMFHQVDYKNLDYSTTPKILKEILVKVKSSGLDVVLPSQIIKQN